MKRKTVQIEDKAIHPIGESDSPKLVRIRIKPGHAIRGLGTAGEIVTTDETQAEYAVKIGYADYVDVEV